MEPGGTKLYLVRFVKRGTWTLALQSPPTKSILKPSSEADLNDHVWKQLPLPVGASVLVDSANLAECTFLFHCPLRVQGTLPKESLLSNAPATTSLPSSRLIFLTPWEHLFLNIP